MMKMKKALLALIITCVLAATLIISLSAEVKAETATKYFGLYNNSNYRPTNVLVTTYCMTGTNQNKPVVKIYEYNGAAQGSSIKDNTAQIYCLKAGLGFGASGEYTGNTITPYTYYHNLKDKSGMDSVYQNTLPSGDYYKEMVWVLDNLIDPRDGDTTDDSAILSAAGTSLSAFKTTRNGTMTDEQYANIIESIQQCVIWFFTNRDTSNEFTQQAVKTYNDGGDYIQTLVAGIKYGSSANTPGSGTPLTTLYNQVIAANTPAGKLASYYITQAIANKDSALSSTTNTATFDKSNATVVKVDGYYYVGPYKYTGVNASSVTITTPNSAPHTLVKAANASGAELSGSTDLAKINGNKNTNFYIKVPIKYNNKTVTGNISINVKASYTNKTLTYWNVAGAVNNNQPLAVIAQTPGSLNATDTKAVSNPEFDLALRKYITKITSADGTVKFNSTDRVPTISTPPTFGLDDGTTARKNHTKTAMQIESGDIVTYTITVYNEGTVAGTNVTVTDYLPSGLTYQSGGWTAGTASSGYTPYTLNFGTINAYDEGNTLPSVSKTITCKVTATQGTSRIDLKNIAEITAATGGTDRDSTPRNLTPSTSYNPSTATQGKGVQDDDDYEHLYLPPKQDFDLALRKYITQIKKADGTVRYSSSQLSNRVPTISTPPTFNLDNGTTARKAHQKDALKVEEGDVVTYTITVYNEADVAGTNVTVTDYLPAGLTYQAGGWTAGTASNGYTPYTLNFGTVAAYDGENTLSSVSKTITCKVTSEAGDNRIDLKNIAEITTATGGTDRDSTPRNLTPSTSYNPSTAPQGKGVQDDDDYEHLYLAPRQEFDLALRKYITEIKKADGTVRYSSSQLSNRTPTISTPPTFNLGTNHTTATKAHQKDALKVEEGDIVTYKITVYNEGDLGGSNIIVTDYLPAGLTYESNGSDGWTAGTASNGYTPYTLNYGSLAAYNGGNTLPSVSKTIVCKVTATAGSDRKDLKNITEITSATGGTDRDSTPGNLTPNSNYNPSTAEQGMGVQDDDDYEHLYLEPNREFDLALRKYITEIKKADGTVKYSAEQLANRTPTISNPPTFNLDNGKTAGKTHQKDALKVEEGDIVTYTITVYNEGEVAASNVVVTDYLPTGLTYESGGWAAGTAANGYTPYTLTFGNVAVYDGGSTLPSVSKTITCKVTAEAGDSRIDLKNIAEITNSSGGTDRDSTPKNLTPSDDYNPSTAPQGKGVQDDDDFEHLYIEPEKIVDLALRKHISKIEKADGTIVATEEQLSNRNPSITTPPTFNLDNGTTAGKTHTKAAIAVKTGYLITYRINVYNEGNVAAQNVVVTDYIPEGLEVVSEGWTKGETDANGYTAYTKTYPTVPAATANALGEVSEDIVCKVVATSGKTNINLKNIAEITTFDGEDRDSTPGTITPSDDYNPADSEKGKGVQDDDDYEHLVIEPNTFDLALKKFIAGVNGEELKTNGVYDRAPSVDTSKRDGDTVTSFTYTFSANKEPIKVENNDVITYIIRVYNEGGEAGYAKQIKDDIPEGLVFLPENATNTKNGWYMIDSSGNKTTDVNKAVSVVTDDFGYGKDKAKLLKAFDPDTMANNPDYLDVEIAFKVGQPAKTNKERVVINSAEITDDSDENGVDIEDIDSKVDNMTPGKPKEDDEDIEKIYIKYFDLSLRKWVTEAIVIEDGKQTTKKTGHKPEDNPEALVKVEVNKKRIESTVIKFKYSIRVTNEGEIAGAATEISEYVPDGLKFDPADNPDWKQSNGKITTTKLKDKILKPGEYADVEIILTWVNSANNVKAMNNIAEISDDYNESGTPDVDSIPNNKKDGEDDIDDAPVIVTMVTGSKPTYFLLAGSVLAIIVSGAALLKKYVLS